jgi:hypothetical protein
LSGERRRLFGMSSKPAKLLACMRPRRRRFA